MERCKFTREFTREAVKLIDERGVTVVDTSRYLGVHGTVLRRWGQECAVGSGDHRNIIWGTVELEGDCDSTHEALGARRRTANGS